MRISRAGAYNDRGFTMIELAMVLLVIGIVGAIVMPRIGGVLDRQQMRRTINMVRGTVRYLQARAALTKRVYRLTFDLDRQVMSVCYLSSDGCEPEPTRELRNYSLPATVRILDVINPQGTKTREGEAVTHFHPTGLAEPSTIHLEGSDKRQMTVMIEPLAGRVKVLDGYVEPQTG
jgi:prepilin-type N-terminal cleavage/methylation domain-containing protein